MQRSVREMVDRLRVNTELLENHMLRVEQGHEDYLGEVAAKCRLLVLKTGGNKPLLPSLARLTGHGLMVETGALPPGMKWEDGIGGGDMVDLDRWLDMMSGSFQTPLSNGENRDLSKRELIKTWAEQSGAAHEDWGLLDTLHSAKSGGVHIAGLQAAAAQLMQIAFYIRSLCLNYLDSLEPQFAEYMDRAQARRDADLDGTPWPC